METTQKAPGIIHLLQSFPEHGKALGQLAETVLRGESPLPPYLRELIAVLVSMVNSCTFCKNSHLAALCHLKSLTFEDFQFLSNKLTLGVVNDLDEVFELIKTKFEVPEHYMNILHYSLAAALSFERLGINIAKNFHSTGAKDYTEAEIESVILVASAFSMFNRYVILTNNEVTLSLEEYWKMGENLAKFGYLQKKNEDTEIM